MQKWTHMSPAIGTAVSQREVKPRIGRPPKNPSQVRISTLLLSAAVDYSDSTGWSPLDLAPPNAGVMCFRGVPVTPRAWPQF